jgi:hypothetical protein
MEVGQYSIYMYVIKWGKVPRIQKVLLKKLKTYLNPHKNLSESSSPFRTSKMHKKKTPTPFNIVYPFHVQESFATSIALT